MKGDNRIAIPWYRKAVKEQQFEDITAQPIAPHRFDIPKPNTRPKPNAVRQPQTVRQPSTVTASEPATQPNPFGVPVMSPVPDFGFDPNNPFPVPFPIPNPKDNKSFLPSPNPTPQPAYSENWATNFAKNVTLVAGLTGIATKTIYDYVASYDFEKQGIGNFRKDAIDEFGIVAATMLTVAIVGKEFVSLWGKRASRLFSPPIILDDDFYKDNFQQNSWDT